jgi:predicted amidophosphoribosyltransferase
MTTVLKGHARYSAEIAVYGDYKPWNVHKADGGTRSDFPEHSARILDLKEGKPAAVSHFTEMIERELPDNVAIVTVPSHDPTKTGGGLKLLAAALAKQGNRVDASGWTKKINKLAHGGDRSKEVHLNSISAAKAELVKGRDVVLLDDVTKTGNSLAACKALLLKAGARSVLCAAIGKT